MHTPLPINLPVNFAFACQPVHSTLFQWCEVYSNGPTGELLVVCIGS